MTGTATILLNLLPLLLGELIDSVVNSLTSSNEQAGDNFLVGFKSGEFELFTSAISKKVTPQNSFGIRPGEKA
jgi:hypothetical protein